MQPSLIQALRQTRFPHNGLLGPRRYGLVQHRILPVGTAAPTHPINPVPPPTKCSLFGPRWEDKTWWNPRTNSWQDDRLIFRHVLLLVEQ